MRRIQRRDQPRHRHRRVAVIPLAPPPIRELIGIQRRRRRAHRLNRINPARLAVAIQQHPFAADARPVRLRHAKAKRRRHRRIHDVAAAAQHG